MLRRVAVLLWLTGLFFVVPAQIRTAALYGRVSDLSGAPVLQAEVIATSKAGISSRTESDEYGNYEFPALAPSTYTVSTGWPGFRKAITTAVAAESGTRVPVDLLLSPDAGTVQTEPPPAANAVVAAYNRARRLAASGENEAAQASLQEIVTSQPKFVPAMVALANLQLTAGDPEKALETAMAAIRVDRQHLNRALIPLLESITRLRPESSSAWFELGRVTMLEQQYKLSEQAFEKAYHLDPRSPQTLMAIVESYMGQNKADKAIRLIQDAIARDPKRSDLHVALGNTAVRAGKYEMALAEFNTALEAAVPGSKGTADLYTRIGETYRLLNDIEKAMAALEKARAIDPASRVVLSTIALVLDSAGRKTQAMEAYRRWIEADSGNGIPMNNLAFLLADSGGDLDEALALARRAQGLLPRAAEITDTLAWVYLKRGQPAEATPLLRGIVARFPARATFHYHLAIALAKKGEKAEALQELEAALHNSADPKETAGIKAFQQQLR